MALPHHPGMRVLIAEDEPRIAGAVARGLRREGMAVDIAADGAAALFKARVVPYDVVVLDRDLPRVHGDDVCRALTAEQPETKVLMLTRGAVDRRPGRRARAGRRRLPAEAVPVRRAGRAAARAGAPGGRRAAAGADAPRDVVLDPARRTATRGGRDLDLTPKEFAVLEVLLSAQGAVVSPEDLVEHAWDEGLDPLSNTVRMTIMTLRRKLGAPAARGDGPRERLPRVSPGLRVRLTALYAGLFALFVGAADGRVLRAHARAPRPHPAVRGGRERAGRAAAPVRDRVRRRDARRHRARLGARRPGAARRRRRVRGARALRGEREPRAAQPADGDPYRGRGRARRSRARRPRSCAGWARACSRPSTGWTGCSTT